MVFTSRDPDFTILAGEEQLETLRLDQLYRDWRHATRDGAPPDAGFLDPAQHDYVASMLVVIDVERQGEQRRYRYRSAGRHFIEYTGVDPAGLYMDQHPEPDFAKLATRACDLVVQTGRPIHARIRREIDGRRFGIEFLLLPVAGLAGSAASHVVTALLVAQIYTPDDAVPPATP
jgi:hypothetical protein